MATAESGNINSTTIDLWRKTIVPQVLVKIPLLARMLMKKQITMGGKAVVFPAEYGTYNGIAQAYTPNETLQNQDVTLFKAPKFDWKYFQVPVQYGIDEKIKNAGAARIVDLLGAKVKAAQKLARYKLKSMMYDATTTEASSEFESMPIALTHDVVYGGLTRTIGSTLNTWWQGASVAGTYTDWDTAMTPSIANIRKMMAPCTAAAEENHGEYLLIVGPTIFQALQSEAQTSRIYTPGGTPLFKYGFNTMSIDGVEIVSDTYLDREVTTRAINSTRQKYMFLLYVPAWHLELYPSRAFTFNGYTHQANQVNGKDFWLGRIMTAGKFYTDRPGASMFRSNVS